MKYLLVSIPILLIIILTGYKAVKEQESASLPVSSTTSEVVDAQKPSVQEHVQEWEGVLVDLHNQGLTNVPQYVFGVTQASVLNLSDNNLTGALPAEIRHLQNLQVLNLSNNQFTGVPAEIGQLGKLEVLDLSGNPITGLPLELANLQSLDVLDLRDTEYSSYDLGIIRQSLPSTVEIRVD